MSGTTDMLGRVDMLARIRADQREAGEPVWSGASAASVAAARRALAGMALALPDDHAEWLLRSDGLDWDGLLIYAAEPTSPEYPSSGPPGLAACNALWREGDVEDDVEGDAVDGTVLGEHGPDLLVAHVGGASLRDRVTMERVEDFASASAMIDTVAARLLGDGADDER